MTKVQRFGHANWCLYAPDGKSRCICGTVKYNPPIADTQSKPAPEGVAAMSTPRKPLTIKQLRAEIMRRIQDNDKSLTSLAGLVNTRKVGTILAYTEILRLMRGMK